MNRLTIFFFVLVLFVLFTPNIEAKKSVAPSISASGRLVKSSNSVSAYFGNIKGVKRVTYTLMYEGNGVGQGVVGSFVPGKKTSFSKNLFLGTCSGRVCIKHRNIKNIQLEVVTKYTNGKSATKLLKVK
jgi:hypothetical protein